MWKMTGKAKMSLREDISTGAEMVEGLVRLSIVTWGVVSGGKGDGTTKYLGAENDQ